MKISYPHTIQNGHGEELTFVRLVKTEQGEIVEVENKVQPGAGPPMHVHYLQDESITVVHGKIAAQIFGYPPTFHGPGETVTFKRGVAHRFWNAGDDILICKGWISPPHNIVYFLTEIYRSVAASGNGRPTLFDGAYLQTKYKSEFDMVEIPCFVKTVVFPIVLALGKLKGQHKRFKEAPEAVRA